MVDKENIKVTFPDGATKEFIAGINGLDIANSISKSLSKKAVAIEINGKEQDLCESINEDVKISISIRI